MAEPGALAQATYTAYGKPEGAPRAKPRRNPGRRPSKVIIRQAAPDHWKPVMAIRSAIEAAELKQLQKKMRSI